MKDCISHRKAHSANLACLLAWIIAMISVSGHVSARASEKVLLNIAAGKTWRCEVLRITQSEIHVRPDGESEQVVQFSLLTAKEVCACYKQAIEPKNAALRFDMGVYFLKNNLNDEARTELIEAGQLSAALKSRADVLLKTIPANDGPVIKSVADLKNTSDKPDKSKSPSIQPGDAKSKPSDDSSENRNKEDFRKRFMRREVPALTDAQMKEFLAKRLDELNKIVGGSWRMIETRHYYCFSNIPETKHRYIATQWNETLYDLLCSVLKHKDGDKLWNNKMPVYYFDTFRQFQHFATTIDHSPGVAYSGGYFAADGRDVHICVPFMSERHKGTARMDEMARSTICHEGTHAFLQLSGEDVTLSNWLHEGIAQFIEFQSDTPDNPDRRDTLTHMKEVLISNHGQPPTWDQMKNRPFDGTDTAGYCCAYAKIEFLYRYFDHGDLPKMIRLIKSGKSESDAMETVFKMEPDKLEEGFRKWIKDAAKTNFNFGPP